MSVSTRPIDVPLSEFRQALERADRNQNGDLRDPEDTPLVVRYEGVDSFVPLTPAVYELARELLTGGRPADLGSDAALIRVPVLDDPDRPLIDQDTIRELMLLQGHNPVTLDALAAAFPQARLANDGPRLAEIAERRLPDGTRLGDCFFRPDGSLGLHQSRLFRQFLEEHAPTIAQLLTTERQHADRRCHTAEAFTLSECNPDKWPTTYENLIRHGQFLVVDLSAEGLPPALRARRDFIVERLVTAQQAGQLPQISVEDDREVLRIDLRDSKAVRDLLVFIDQCTSATEFATYCHPTAIDNIHYYSGLRHHHGEGDLGPETTDEEVYLALVALFGHLTAELLRIEFDPRDVNDPARMNRKVGQPAIVANVSIPFSLLRAGKFGRAVFSYQLPSHTSFIPRGGIWTGNIYATGQGRAMHEGDNEALRGFVSWSESSPLHIEALYSNAHGAHLPIDPATTNGVIATGYRSGALMELERLPDDEDGVVISRQGYSGLLSGGSSAAVSFVDLNGHGFNAAEGVVTRGVLARRGPPAAALLYPTRADGTVIATRYAEPSVLYRNAVRVPYQLVIEEPYAARFRFYLGRKGKVGVPGVNTGDEAEMLRFRTQVIEQGYLGRGVVTEVGPLLAPRSLVPGALIAFRPQTVSFFTFGGAAMGSFYLFFPLHRRTLDWPRLRAQVLAPVAEDPQFHLDLDLLHAAGGYNFGAVHLMAGLDLGTTGHTGLTEWSPAFGAFLRPHAYLGIPLGGPNDLRIGADFRASTSEYPQGSGHHWEFTTGVSYVRRWNLSLF